MELKLLTLLATGLLEGNLWQGFTSMAYLNWVIIILAIAAVGSYFFRPRRHNIDIPFYH